MTREQERSEFVEKLKSGEFKLGLGFAGAWLIGLIAISLAAAVFIFSAEQIQLRFASFILNRAPLSVWKAEEFRTQWRESRVGGRAAVESARTILDAIRETLPQARALRTQARQNETQARADAAKIRKDLLEKIEKVDASFSRTLSALSAEQFVTAVKGREVLLKADSSIGPDTDKYALAQKTLLESSEVSTARSGEFQALLDQIQQRQDAVTAAEQKARLSLPTAEDVDQKESDDQKFGQRPQIENAIYEFDHMYDTSLGRVVHFFSLFPSDVLTLLLVISMGLLGSSLQLNYVYVTKFEERTPGFYIMRPFFGIITAFVVFIVAKAGIPLIADPTRLGANAPINPYFISFLAIISGLLSERALVALVRVGSNYFRDSDTTDTLRWSRTNLIEEFATAKRDPEHTRILLKAKAAEWKDWIEGKEPMPSGVQTMIAAVLDRPRRDLFTDIPPDLAPALAGQDEKKNKSTDAAGEVGTSAEGVTPKDSDNATSGQTSPQGEQDGKKGD